MTTLCLECLNSSAIIEEPTNGRFQHSIRVLSGVSLGMLTYKLITYLYVWLLTVYIKYMFVTFISMSVANPVCINKNNVARKIK